MKLTLIDKSYNFSPLNFDKSIIAKVEIECKDDEELMAVLSYIGSVDVNAILPKKAILVAVPKSGVQPAQTPEPSHSETTNESIPENKGEDSTLGPISSLEID